MSLIFCDKNKELCEKVKELEIPDLVVENMDILKCKEKYPDFKICTASNPDFSAGGGLDKILKDKYPEEWKQAKEFNITENLFFVVSVDNTITDSNVITRALAGVLGYKHKDLIITGIGTAIGNLDISIFLDLVKKIIRSADLSFANLRSADLRSADLSFANLRSADLSSADLSSADLRSADLSSANLRDADLTKTISNELTSNFNLNCPEEWSFIWWKKCEKWHIVKLQIPVNAKRSSATSRKCRAEYVKVLAIYDWDKEIKETKSKYDNGKTKYVVWKITRCDNWEDNRWIECAWGIHFLITRIEAEQRN